MPQPPNKVARVLVLVGVLIIGLGVVVSVFVNSSNRQQPQNPPPKTATPAQPTPQPAPQAAATGAAPAPTAPEQAPAPKRAETALAQPTPGLLDGLKARPSQPAAFTPLGSLDPLGTDEIEIRFSQVGAGIERLALSRHYETIEKRLDAHSVMQREHDYTPPPTTEAPSPFKNVITPMAADALLVNDIVVPLLFTTDPSRPDTILPLWRETAPGSFEAVIQNAAGTDIARVRRTYSITPRSFVVKVDQKVDNLTGQPLEITWKQFGPVELDQGTISYGGDRRHLRFGYLLRPEIQRADPTVSSNDFVLGRTDSTVLGSVEKSTGQYQEVKPVWPNPKAAREQYRLVWTGLSNRYFGAALVPAVDPTVGPDAKVLKVAAGGVDRVVLQQYTLSGGKATYDPIIILRTTSEKMTVPAGGAGDVTVALYAGPLDKSIFSKEPATAASNLDGFVVLSFGGPCGWCTFQFLTNFVLGLMRFLHNNIVFDWALAIMVLVLCVRTVLHPVTKWSQIRLQRFGKQMQGMAPKQKKIQEKYGSDPQKLREEMGKLWKEEGISPTGALGCIPMFLQMPVWYAISATLFFAFELRHQPGFFGVFQAIVPNHPKLLGWFMGDLAEPDRFYYFGRDVVSLPLLGQISSVNILPLILGVVFFIQQKYLTPPPSTPLTPEQESQQRMMKWMMVFMFPVMMYNAPSGLALYFIVNSTLGILESRYIRSHIDKYDLLKPPTKGGGKPRSGFMARLQAIAEERQKQMLKAKGQYPPRKRV